MLDPGREALAPRLATAAMFDDVSPKGSDTRLGTALVPSSRVRVEARGAEEGHAFYGER